MIRRLVRLIGGLGLLGAIAFVVWPASLGGAATFVVVRGESMEPTYHQGDLLYARSDGSYAPGDVAVYRIPKGSPGAGTLVVHRIKERLSDGAYLFQGDNKPSPDDVTPSRGGIVASPLVNLGSWPTRALILAPIVCTLIVGIAVAWAMWPAKEDDDGDDEEGENDEARESDDNDTVAAPEAAATVQRVRVLEGLVLPDLPTGPTRSELRRAPRGDPRRGGSGRPRARRSAARSGRGRVRSSAQT